VTEKNGLITGTSFLNHHWYDAISPINNLSEVDIKILDESLAELKQRDIDFAFYVNSNDKELVNNNLEQLQLKHNGGDAHMLRNLKGYPSKTLNKIEGLVLKPVDDSNFRVYRKLIEEVHGDESGLTVAGDLAEVLFKASKNKEIEQKVITLLAFVDDKPAGYSAAIYSRELNLAYLTNSGVTQEFRRRGIHSQMVNYRIKKAEKLGISRIYVITGQDSNSWRSVQKQGFEEVARYEYYLPKTD